MADNTATLRSILPRGSARCEVTELHVHLGGSVPLYRLWEMGLERGIRGVAGSYEDFIKLLHRNNDSIGSLDQYLEIFDTVELIQAGPRAVAEAVRIAINGAYRTGGMNTLGPGGEGGDPQPAFAITRLELRFNPMKRTGVLLSRGTESGLFDVDRIILAACEAVRESEIAYRGAFQCGLILCFGRDLAPEVNRTLAAKINYWKKQDPHIIGIDIAGPESANNFESQAKLEEFAEIYRSAEGGLGKTVHVGETEHVSLDTFIQTVEALEPDRVAHPVVAARAYWDSGDKRGLELLASRNIVCELCVHSNLLTGAVNSIAEYGRLLETFDEFGIRYTFSTDSPALQKTTLASELDMLLREKAATAGQINQALTTSREASFLPKSPGLHLQEKEK